MNRFKQGDSSLSCHPKSGRQSIVHSDSLLTSIKADPFQSTRDLSTATSSQSSIVRKLQEPSSVLRTRQWISHDLSPDQNAARADACLFYVSRSRRWTGWTRSLQDVRNGRCVRRTQPSIHGALHRKSRKPSWINKVGWIRGYDNFKEKRNPKNM